MVVLMISAKRPVYYQKVILRLIVATITASSAIVSPLLAIFLESPFTKYESAIVSRDAF